MSYSYLKERPRIFTEKGQVEFLKVRDRVNQMLCDSGAFMMQNAWKPITGDTWMMMAYVDRLVELGEIREIEWDAIGQCRVFIEG
jgi:hypothetical protein